MNKIVVLLLSIFTFAELQANICLKGRDQKIDSETKKEVDLYEKKFISTYHGNRSWNEILVRCNRKRDNNGGKIKSILGTDKYDYLKDMYSDSNLGEKLIKGKYSFFGLAPFKYRYLVKKEKGVWKMTLLYNPILNDTVKDRVDFFMGWIDSSGYDSTDKDQHAWKLYDEDQLMPQRAGSTKKIFKLKSTAQPIAETLCQSTTFFEGKEKKYDGQNDLNSYKRDKSNKHISLGKIQYAYTKKDTSWKEGCRVKANRKIYWLNPDTNQVEESTAKNWIFDNFVRVGEDYWTIPGEFELKIYMHGHNESNFSDATKKLFSKSDLLTIRFATKFMPYKGNQMYKSNAWQFNNFSTMTTNETYFHEIGHAFGLDDEYAEKTSDKKDNDCKSDDFSSMDTGRYQMCDGGVSDKRTIYHYIATSRYLITQICKKDSDCDSGQYCNNRIGINRCLSKSSKKIGENCIKDKECSSNSCEGTGDNKVCTCKKDSHCGNDRFCVNQAGKNVCLADGTKAVGKSCAKNRECKSNKCQGKVGNQVCVCNKDSDCGSGQYCNNRIGQNRCLSYRSLDLGESCIKDKECKSNKCESKQCVCKSDSDCGNNKKCKKPVFSKNYCK